MWVGAGAVIKVHIDAHAHPCKKILFKKSRNNRLKIDYNHTILINNLSSNNKGGKADFFDLNQKQKSKKSKTSEKSMKMIKFLIFVLQNINLE